MPILRFSYVLLCQPLLQAQDQSHWSEAAPDLAQRGALTEQDDASKTQTCHSSAAIRNKSDSCDGRSSSWWQRHSRPGEWGLSDTLKPTEEPPVEPYGHPPTQISLGFVYWFDRSCCCCCLWPHKQQSWVRPLSSPGPQWAVTSNLLWAGYLSASAKSQVCCTWRITQQWWQSLGWYLPLLKTQPIDHWACAKASNTSASLNSMGIFHRYMPCTSSFSSVCAWVWLWHSKWTGNVALLDS